MSAVLFLILSVASIPVDLADCNKSGFLPLREASEYCDGCMKVKSVTLSGERRYQVTTSTGGMGADGLHETRYALVDPESCRAVGLLIESGGGSPASSASFIRSNPKDEVLPEEQEYLKALAGFVAFDPKNPADALASNGFAQTPPDEPAPWIVGKPAAQRLSWMPSRPEPLVDPDQQSCPCYRIWAGNAFKLKASQELGATKLHLYATSARNRTWTYALERAGRTLWFTGRMGDHKLLPPEGKHFRLQIFDAPEATTSVEVIDSMTGKVVQRRSPAKPE